MGFAVLATTIALVAVFVPLAFLTGNIGRLFNEFGVSVAVSVLISGFVALSLAFAKGEVKKRYVALVKGRVEAARTLSSKLKKTRGGKVKTADEGEEGKPSKTRVRPLETFATATLLECEPLTGRTHQIRVQLADAGLPLLVDHQYGRAEPLTAAELARVDAGYRFDEHGEGTFPFRGKGIGVPTLRDVLTTANANDQHGKTSHLTADQLNDLVEYLLSL